MGVIVSFVRGAASAVVAVFCPGATACTALGSSPGALAWNGTTWVSQRVPIPTANGSGLTGVSCTSATMRNRRGAAGTTGLARRR
jgi:hypothetical protein